MTQNIAYLAGIIDGEGCISIRKWQQRNKYWIYSLTLDVGNTNRILTDWLSDNFGGTVILFHSKNPRHNDRYCWRLSQGKAGIIIKKVLPYLLIKKEQAVLALEYRKTFLKGNTAGLPSKIVLQRDKMIEKMHKLNKRGIS